MNKDQFHRVTKWQKETFGQATALSKVNHLKLEVDELINDLKSNNPERRKEFADCFLLLFGAAESDGMTYEDIINCIDEKFDIVKKRTWGKPDENGVVKHIKIEDVITKEFCQECVNRQNEYLDNLQYSKLPDERIKELYASAYSMKKYWLEKYNSFD